MVRPLAAAVLVLPLLLGCRDKPAEDEASIRESLEEKGTVDLMDQVSKARTTRRRRTAVSWTVR
ncbi:MAG TPA: hypothetical protein VLE27_10730 [Thermoanaerobaculia bacterium]|nr:hypothetical protein [Thermoanaerobaculia bacterium]